MIQKISQKQIFSAKEIDSDLNSISNPKKLSENEKKPQRDPKKRIPKNLLTEEDFAKKHVSLFSLYPELAPYKIIDFHYKDNRNELHHQIFPATQSLSVFDIRFRPKEKEKVS